MAVTFHEHKDHRVDLQGGILRPLDKVDLKEGKKVKLLLRDEREDVLDRHAGSVKLGRTVRLKEILDLGEGRWQHSRTR